jgi:hypothetical protein
VGFTLLLIGTVFVITPDLFGSVIDFFKDFGIVEVPNTDISFLGLEHESMHMTFYQAVGQISIALAVFQVFMLVLRFAIPSTWEKRSETAGNIVSWAGTAFLVQALLIDNTQWFAYWAAVIIVMGVSMIVRAIVNAIAKM